MKPPVTVGETVRLAEEDYCYGRGALTLPVTAVPTQLHNPAWVDLQGIEITCNGEHRGERWVRVRVSALRDPRIRRTS